MQNSSESRSVLKYYTVEFLDKFMYIFLTSSIIFYSLWCSMAFTNIEKSNYLMYSILFVIFIVMKYSLDLENEKSLGDPIDIIYSDKILVLSSILYVIYMGGVIYA